VLCRTVITYLLTDFDDCLIVAVLCRTVINDEAFNNWNNEAAGFPEQHPGAAMDAESFMAAMELDCRERAERRKVGEAAAEKLKLTGNEAFNAGDYLKAVELYTEALSHVRHWTALYTNRAQAYLQLENFEVFWSFFC